LGACALKRRQRILDEDALADGPVVGEPVSAVVGKSLRDAANSLLVSINSLFGAIKFPVPISRELSSNKLILLRSDGRLFAKRPDFRKIPCPSGITWPLGADERFDVVFAPKYAFVNRLHRIARPLGASLMGEG
jgi:hypothetical protein